MTTAKDLLLAAGYDLTDCYKEEWEGYYNGNHYFIQDISEPEPDDNLCDMLIRELSEEQWDFFEDILGGVVGSIFQNCTYGASLLRATAKQKALALMETYKEKE